MARARWRHDWDRSNAAERDQIIFRFLRATIDKRETKGPERERMTSMLRLLEETVQTLGCDSGRCVLIVGAGDA